jgi:protocatechuate 3,4-dioxygenase beta subunit
MSLATAAQAQPVVSANQPQAKPAVKPEDKCSIEGTVVNAVTGEPLKKAHLVLRKADSNQMEAAYGASTDDAGRYSIKDIDPGRYSFFANRNGFVASNYGAKPKRGFAAGTALTLAPRQAMKDVLFRLTPHAVVAGRVVDEDGEPVANAQIQCLRTAYVNGRKDLVPAGGFANTDDKGQFRAYGLPPGKYFVSAMFRNMQDWGLPEIRSDASANDTYVTTYYPSAVTERNAIPIEVPQGAEITAIEIKLVRMRAVQVSGVVAGAPAPRPINVMLSPKSGNTMMSWATMRHAMTDPKGAFVFRGVMPGTYMLQANTMSDDQKPMQATTTIEVGDSNLQNVQLAFASAATLTGRVMVDGKEDLSDLKDRQVNIHMQPTESMYGPGGAGGTMKADGTFELRNVSADRYRIAVWGLPDSYYLKSVRFGPTEAPKEVLDLSKGVSAGELTIAVSANGAQVEGVVQDKDHKPAGGVMVVAVPEERDYAQRYRTGNTDQYGHYVLKALAPGKYKVFAFDDIEWGAQEDPDFMKAYEERGESVEVKDGAKESRNLTLIVTDESADQKKTGSSN